MIRLVLGQYDSWRTAEKALCKLDKLNNHESKIFGACSYESLYRINDTMIYTIRRDGSRYPNEIYTLSLEITL